MDLLRFITAGSVDDGKSTLIGRLLYDSKGILVDQLEAVERSSRLKGRDGIDLALLTDGLRAEREQGITIDVAYRYFSTPKRKFIMADAPGHIQYTRNMVTGASMADAIIILIDARNGVVEQTRRHSIIAALLKVRHVIVAINKMDLIEFSEQRYQKISEDYQHMASKIGLKDLHIVPISALMGDNVVERSVSMPWHTGPSLLMLLEDLEPDAATRTDHSSMQVQYVIRPKQAALHDYRGYAGRVDKGILRKGDAVQILPSGLPAHIEGIEVAGEEVEEAFAGMSIVVRLKEDVDVGRGDTIASSHALPNVSAQAEAHVCWLDDKPLQTGNRYLLQHNSRLVRAMVTDIMYKIDVNSLETISGDGQLKLNEVAKLRIKTAAPLVYDAFDDCRTTGSAILVDETSNATVAALMFLP